jgi:hypothetical protein
MTNLINGLNSLFTLFWSQLSNFTNWFINDPIGQIILFILIIEIIVWIVILIISLGKQKKES